MVKTFLFCQMEGFPFEGSFDIKCGEARPIKNAGPPPHAGTPIINQSTNVQKLYGSVQASFSHGLFEQGFYRTT